MALRAIDQSAALPANLDARPLAAPRQGGRLLDASCRALDVLGAAIMLVVLLPLLGVISLAITLDSPGPVLFRQRRVGRDRQPFMVNKFRTMRHGVAHGRVRSP